MCNAIAQPKLDAQELSSEHHHWCTFPQVRPLHCNVCSESLSGVMRTEVALNGLSCEGKSLSGVMRTEVALNELSCEGKSLSGVMRTEVALNGLSCEGTLLLSASLAKYSLAVSCEDRLLRSTSNKVNMHRRFYNGSAIFHYALAVI